MLISSSSYSPYLRAALILTVGVATQTVLGIPFRPVVEHDAISPTHQLPSRIYPASESSFQRRTLLDDEDSKKEGEFASYKSKQPSTPPSSLASDPYSNYIYEKSLAISQSSLGSKERTIIVGDVHGNFIGLEHFLKQIKFNQDKDMIIFAGDIVAKGPQSLEVIDKARSINAKCVRGNHDDKVIRWKGYLDSLSPVQRDMLDVGNNNSIPTDNSVPSDPELSVPSDLIRGSDHYHIARNLNNDQYQYLLSCPLILSLSVDLQNRNIPIRVVHAGIDPTLNIKSQKPWVLENVRNIRKDGVPSRKRGNGHGWANMFNDIQSDLDDNEQPVYTLVYGHDAGRSLNVKPWSIGLDSGCVYGGALSGYIVETDEIISVPCPDLITESEDD
ncbi:hypothetical protein BGZ76_005275 [Entomortierella beljakovae]|nr:hypothetical protein BGZ76_005275 [Entomortierella beljakovae]